MYQGEKKFQKKTYERDLYVEQTNQMTDYIYFY